MLIHETLKNTMAGKTDPKGKKEERRSLPGVQTRTGKPSAIPVTAPRDPLTTTPNRSADSKSGDKLQEILNKLDKLEQLDVLEERIDTSTKQLTEKIEESNEKTERLSSEYTEVKVDAAILKTQVSIHGLRLNDLEAKIEQLEREKRRTTLVIDGVRKLKMKTS